MTSRMLFGFALAPALLAMAACSTLETGGPAARPTAATTTTTTTATTTAVAASPAAAVRPAAEYRIASDDTLEIAVFKVPDLGRTVQVDARGNIDMPLIGQVKAGGRTARELEADLARQLGDKYLRSPQVSVIVKDGLAQRYAVDGAVMKPGIYLAKGDTTLMQAITQAGGPNEVGNIDDVAIIRDVSGRRDVTRYSLRSIRTGKAPDPPVYGKDAVVVGESGALSTLKFVRDLGSPVLGAARVVAVP